MFGINLVILVKRDAIWQAWKGSSKGKKNLLPLSRSRRLSAKNEKRGERVGTSSLGPSSYSSPKWLGGVSIFFLLFKLARANKHRHHFRTCIAGSWKKTGVFLSFFFAWTSSSSSLSSLLVCTLLSPQCTAGFYDRIKRYSLPLSLSLSLLPSFLHKQKSKIRFPSPPPHPAQKKKYSKSRRKKRIWFRMPNPVSHIFCRKKKDRKKVLDLSIFLLVHTQISKKSGYSEVSKWLWHRRHLLFIEEEKNCAYN